MQRILALLLLVGVLHAHELDDDELQLVNALIDRVRQGTANRVPLTSGDLNWLLQTKQVDDPATHNHDLQFMDARLGREMHADELHTLVVAWWTMVVAHHNAAGELVSKQLRTMLRPNNHF